MINMRIFHRAKKWWVSICAPWDYQRLSHEFPIVYPCVHVYSHCLWLSINYSLSMSMYKSPIIYIYIYYSLSTVTVCFPSKLPLIIPWLPMFQVLPGTRKIAEFQARMDEPWLFISGRWPPCWWWISELSCTIEIHWWQTPL